MSKSKRIEIEENRIRNLFSELDEKEKKLIDGLIIRASFMKITLEDYEEEIAKNGSTELFTQSTKTEPYERERPVIRLYNTMSMNYLKTMKQLYSILPMEKVIEADPFDSFLSRR